MCDFFLFIRFFLWYHVGGWMVFVVETIPEFNIKTDIFISFGRQATERFYPKGTRRKDIDAQIKEVGRLNIGFIGAGKVGCSLGKYFAENGQGSGLNVKGYYSRSSKSTKDAAHFTESEVYESIEALTDECDVIFLTVPDGSIRDTWQQVREYDIKGKTICHCSGAMSSQDAFEGIEETGAFGYSIHPLFAVSDKYNAYRELTGVFFTLEGGYGKAAAEASSAEWGLPGEAESAGVGGGCGEERHSPEFLQLKEAFEKMGNPVRIIDGADKTTYHCAAAVASNLVCGLIDQSLALMKRCGFAEDEAVKALAPILMGNMAHIAKDGPTESLTGPIERNDTSTVGKHLECLEDSDEKELYKLLSRRLVQMAQSRHPDRDYSSMSELLEG